MKITKNKIKEIIKQELDFVMNEKKKPDADGDGVPDWADKEPGKDDHAKNKKKKKKDLSKVPPQLRKHMTKEGLRQMVREELLNEYGMETYKPEELVVVTQSSDGYETYLEKIGSSDEYTNKLGAYTGLKMLVKVLQVAEDYEDE